MAIIQNLSRSFSGSFSRRKALGGTSFTVDSRKMAALTGVCSSGKFAMARNVSGITAGDEKSIDTTKHL